MRAQIVSFHCVLRSAVGNQVLSSTFNHDVITQVDHAEEAMLPALAEKLQNLKKGERRKIFLPAQEAYGFYDPELVTECSRTEISNGRKLQVGNEVVMQSERGKRVTFRVTQATPKTVTLDGNHPLAGMDLIFEIQTTEAREATTEEVAESSGTGHTRLLN